MLVYRVSKCKHAVGYGCCEEKWVLVAGHGCHCCGFWDHSCSMIKEGDESDSSQCLRGSGVSLFDANDQLKIVSRGWFHWIKVASFPTFSTGPVLNFGTVPDLDCNKRTANCSLKVSPTNHECLVFCVQTRKLACAVYLLQVPRILSNHVNCLQSFP
jgi:hypothetical protein